jgi:hypothetical protein
LRANVINIYDESYLGKFLIANVKASNGLSSQVFTRSTTAITLVPTYSETPIVSGSRVNGSTLSVSEGTWQAFPAISSTSHQWFRCIVSVPTALQFTPASCSEISGATTSTYVQQREDFNSFVTVRTRKVNSVGTTNVWSTVSAPTLQTPKLISEPLISGVAAYGQSLAVSRGTWQNFTSSTSYSFQWFVCDSAVADESGSLPAGCSLAVGTSANLTLTNSHVGKHLVASITATNAAGSTSRFTQSSAAVTSLPSYITDPIVEGNRTTGETLTFSVPPIRAFPAASTVYQWFICTSPVSLTYALPNGCTEIAGANTTTYELRVSDEGKYVTAASTLTNSLASSTVWAPSNQISYGRAQITESGTWIVPEGLTSLDVLIVGGGGNGGNGNGCNDLAYCAGGGGGGGGSVKTILGMNVVPGQSMPVVVGGSGSYSSFGNEISLPGQNGGNFIVVSFGRHGGDGGSGYNSSNILTSGSLKYTCNGALSRCGGHGGGSAVYSDISGVLLPYGGPGRGGSGGPPALRGESGLGVFGAGGGGGGANEGQTSGVAGKSGLVMIRWISGSSR